MIDTFVSFDIETTGLIPTRDKIIEIGAIKVVNGKAVSGFKRFVNPKLSLPKKIIELTGINDSMLKDADEIEVVIREFLDYLEGYVILGHNILFDYSFIKVNAAKEKLEFDKEALDTLVLSRKLHKELESKTLTNMCKHYKIENKNAHRAFDDAKATAQLYFKLCEIFYKSENELFLPKRLIYKVKNDEPITNSQKNYLNDLIKYHKIENSHSISKLTKSEASKIIDKIIFEKGRII